MPSESRLHPFSLVRGVSLRQAAQALPGAIVGVSALGGLGSAAAIGTVLVALVALRVVTYLRHTYELTDDAIVERRGVLQRRERTLHLHRLQQVEVEQGLLDRLVGTAVVRFETASDAGASELDLRVVSEEEARRLRAALPAVAAGPGRDPGEELVHVPLAHVALASITGPRLLAIPVVLGGAVGLLLDLDLIEETREAVVPWIGARGAGMIALAVLVLLLVSVLVALVVGVLRDGDFRIRRVGGDLHVRRGLVATREAVVPVARLQLVAIRRSLVRRWLGFGSLELHSAGGAADQAPLERRLTVPLVAAPQLVPLALRLLGDPGPWPDLAPHPPAARIRAVWRWWRRAAPAVAVVLLLLARGHLTLPGTAVVVVMAGVAATGLGILEHRHLASGRSAALVAARGGALSIDDVVAPARKVQGTRLSSSPFQRRRSLATLTVHIAGPGGAVRMPDLAETAGLEHQVALERPLVSAASAGPSRPSP